MGSHDAVDLRSKPSLHMPATKGVVIVDLSFRSFVQRAVQANAL